MGVRNKDMIKVTNIAGIKIPQFIERNRLPADLKWSGEFPPSYSINLIRSEDGSKTIIACTDSFGGGLSWATTNERLDLVGKDRILESDEQMFLARNYPVLLAEINNL